ncbi:MAG: glycosyltransferase family 9 protein [Candidatus Daviesbacteria bacterium]|nr:glycosyltransferase family 9 protein [Candidatus Daviesbacteria bacterium]
MHREFWWVQDGKELQFYHHLLPGETVDLDMSKMISQMTPAGGVNWDNTIDSQYSHLMNDITTNPDGTHNYKNFEFLITPNDAADNARDIIKITVGADGHAQIPKGVDLHQFFDTKSGDVKQLARFIEVAHVEADGSRTIISTSVGKGIDNILVEGPGTHTLNAIPPLAKELIPPSFEAPPIIPIPFAPRHPLEEIGEEEIGGGYYPEGVFPRGTRIADVIRRGRGIRRGHSPYELSERDITIDHEEGMAALAELRQSFENTDGVYVVLGGAIGDAVISTAYIKGIQQALNQSGKSIPLTIMVSQDQGDLYDAWGQGNIKIVKVARNSGLAEATSAITASSLKNPLIFDFEHARAANPTIEIEEVNNQKITTVANLLIPAVHLYNNGSDSEKRYSKFIEELLSLPENSVDPQIAKPTIELPSNKDQLYENLANRCGIDTNNPNQISIIVEGSRPGKRYGMQNWATVITEIQKQYPNYQFNVLFNKQDRRVGYTEDDIRTTLTNAGVINSCHLVDGTLMELAVLLEKQKLTLTNDSGLAHIAGALKNGPSVVMLFLPKDSSVNMWASSKKHIPIALSKEEEQNLSNVDINDENEDRKLMNKIPPERIIQKALEVLNSQPTAISTPAPRRSTGTGAPPTIDNTFSPGTPAYNAMENHSEAERLLPVWRNLLQVKTTGDPTQLEETIKTIEAKWPDLAASTTPQTTPASTQPVVTTPPIAITDEELAATTPENPNINPFRRTQLAAWNSFENHREAERWLPVLRNILQEGAERDPDQLEKDIKTIEAKWPDLAITILPAPTVTASGGPAQSKMSIWGREIPRTFQPDSSGSLPRSMGGNRYDLDMNGNLYIDERPASEKEVEDFNKLHPHPRGLQARVPILAPPTAEELNAPAPTKPGGTLLVNLPRPAPAPTTPPIAITDEELTAATPPEQPPVATSPLPQPGPRQRVLLTNMPRPTVIPPTPAPTTEPNESVTSANNEETLNISEEQSRVINSIQRIAPQLNQEKILEFIARAHTINPSSILKTTSLLSEELAIEEFIREWETESTAGKTNDPLEVWLNNKLTATEPTPVENTSTPAAFEFTEEQKAQFEDQKEKIAATLETNGIMDDNNLGELYQIYNLITDQWSLIDIEPAEDLKELATSISDRIKGTDDKFKLAGLLANLFSNPDVQTKYPDLNDYFNNRSIDTADQRAIVRRQFFEFMYSLKAVNDLVSPQP